MPAPFPKRRPLPDRNARPAAATAWDPQAQWYDQHQGGGGDDFYTVLILPTVLRRLAATKGQRVLDVASGQGVLGRALAHLGIASLGVDASPALVEAAIKRSGPLERHLVGDARELIKALGGERFDHAAIIMALQDLDPIAPVFTGIARHIPAGGRLVMVLSHPAFRIPKRSSWEWDEEERIQYRRLDSYYSAFASRLRTHPGAAAGTTDAKQETLSFHRPLSAYFNAIGEAGFAVIAADELCSHRRGTNGPRFAAEDRSAIEFPVFLALTAVRL